MSAPTGQTIALIVAAGRGSRAGGGLPKQYRPLLGRPLLAHAVAPFLAHPRVDRVVVVIHPDDEPLYEAAAAGLDLPSPIMGGATRQQSVRAGLEALAAHGAPKYVLIHDAARPFTPAAVIDRVLDALETHPAAVPVATVADSLKQVADGMVQGSIPRDGLARVQTPQGFHFEPLLHAHRAASEGFTDDAGIIEATGLKVAAVVGDETLFKVTESDDFTRAERHLLAAHGDVRVASGYDVHRFTAGDHVMLGGIRVPHTHALEGHSDADVALHALTDALLGTMAAGDIGQAFPPSDPRWKGADSALFLTHARDRVAAAGGLIAHVDITIICERPKVGPHRDAMRARIADLLHVDPARVSVKATTTEGLGFTGRQEGIAAQATATVRLP